MADDRNGTAGAGADRDCFSRMRDSTLRMIPQRRSGRATALLPPWRCNSPARAGARVRAVVPRPARARLDLGDSASDELLGTAEIRTPAFRRSARARGIVRPVAATSVPAGGVVRLLPRDCASQGRRSHAFDRGRSCLCSPWRPPNGESLLRVVRRGSLDRAIGRSPASASPESISPTFTSPMRAEQHRRRSATSSSGRGTSLVLIATVLSADRRVRVRAVEEALL